MNNKLIAGIGVLILIFAAGIFFLNNSATKDTISVTPTPSKQSQVPLKISSQPIEETQVTVNSSGFSPANITVKTGTKVVWINKSKEAVSLNSANHPNHLVYPPLNLGEFGDNSSVQIVFDKKGTYGYHDHLKPEHKGTVIVE